MAVTITKQSETLNVVLNDTNGGTGTFKLNNPMNGVTLAEVQAAFGALFAHEITTSSGVVQIPNLLKNNNGYQYTSLSKAEIVSTVTSTTVLE